LTDSVITRFGTVVPGSPPLNNEVLGVCPGGNEVASEDWATVDFAPPNPVDLGVPQVMDGPATPPGLIEVAESGCYSFVMDASNTAAPILVVTEVSTGFIGAPVMRLTGAPGTADVDPDYSKNGRFVVYSGVIEPQP
jgi:hypothetical protein